MNSTTLGELVLAQFAAEAYLDGVSFGDALEIAARLRQGNNNVQHPAFVGVPSEDFRGYTRMTKDQIDRFAQTYAIVEHLPNTWSGFSATLLRNTTTDKYVLSFRSTEYPNSNNGGDWERDVNIWGQSRLSPAPHLSMNPRRAKT